MSPASPRSSDWRAAVAADEIATKGTVVAVPFDLSTDEEIAHLVAAANERWDGLDILVKNAAPRGGGSRSTTSHPRDGTR